MSIAQPSRPSQGEPLEDILTPEFTSALRLVNYQLPRPVMLEFERYLTRQVTAFNESAMLGTVLAQQKYVLPTEIVSSLNDTEKFWRGIQSEFGFLTSIQVAEALGAVANRSYASDQRKNGRLLALRRLNKNLFPGFQIDDGNIRPVIAKLITLGQESDKTERDIIFWLCTPTTYIRGAARPVEHLHDPDTVLQAAAGAWGVGW